MSAIQSRGTIVLHHVDVMLKSQDPERYAEWRPEDLQPMEKREHISMHNSHPHTKLHNKRIARGVKRANEARQGCVIIAFDPLTDDIEIFPTAASAAASLGCTKQWAGQCLRNGWKCCGYKLMRFSGSQDDFSKAREEVCHA